MTASAAVFASSISSKIELHNFSHAGKIGDEFFSEETLINSIALPMVTSFGIDSPLNLLKMKSINPIFPPYIS